MAAEEGPCKAQMFKKRFLTFLKFLSRFLSFKGVFFIFNVFINKKTLNIRAKKTNITVKLTQINYSFEDCTPFSLYNACQAKNYFKF